MKKVLVTCEMDPVFFSGLAELGFEYDYLPHIKNHQVEEIINQYTGLIVSTKVTVDKAIIDKGIQLRFIGRAGSGMENIDYDYAISKKVNCISSPEGNSNAVAEHALGMLLSLMNNITKGDKEVRNEIWQREANRGIELNGKVVGIIGYGNTGKAFAGKLKGFNVEVLVYDKFLKYYGDDFIKETDLNEIFDRSHILSLHIPLYSDTFRMVDMPFLQSFKNNIILINTSRGKIVDTESLLIMLKSAKLAGACLDVLEDEDISEGFAAQNRWFQKLIELPNVILTPHIAGWTFESKQRISEVLLRKIRELSY